MIGQLGGLARDRRVVASAKTCWLIESWAVTSEMSEKVKYRSPRTCARR